jgi:four helix bundle protein
MSFRASHRKLLAWQQAMDLVEVVYTETARFPKEEIYGLTSQIKRSAISVPSNIAEGAARNSTRELRHYLGISCGSMAELETQLELAIRLGFLKPDSLAVSQLNRVASLLVALRRSLKAHAADDS